MALRAFIASLVVAISGISPSLAQAAINHRLDIPQQDLGSALATLARQSNIQLIYSAQLVQGKTSRAINGSMTPEAALNRLLLPAGLHFEFLDEKTVTITAATPQKIGELAEANEIRLAQVGTSPGAADTSSSPSAVGSTLDELTVQSTAIGSYAETDTTAGTKTPTALKDTPRTVQVLNSSFIGDLRATDLDHLYPYVIGMTRESTTAVGFTLRGFSNSTNDTTLNNLMVDGLPGITSRFGSPPTANVERVEVIKGPISVLYGLMNPGGILNIVTKRPQSESSNSVFVSGASYASPVSGFGDDFSRIMTLDSTGPIDKDRHWMYRFIASNEDLKSFRDFSWFRNGYYFPSLTYRLDENTEVTAQVEVTRQSRHHDNNLVAPYDNFVSLVARYNTSYQEPSDRDFENGEGYGINLKQHFADTFVFNLNLRHVDHRDGWHALETSGQNIVQSAGDPAAPTMDELLGSSVVRRLRRQLNTRKFSFVDANVYSIFGPDWFKNTVLFGVSGGQEKDEFLRQAQVKSSAAYPLNVNLYSPIIGVTLYPPETGPAADELSATSNYGVYLSDQIRFNDQWYVSVGLRYDRQDSWYKDTINGFDYPNHEVHAVLPSAGLVFEPSENISLYVSYAESFAPPAPNEIDYNSLPTLPPERAHQVEAGLKADYLSHRLTTTLALYDIKKTNAAFQDPSAAGLLPNGDQAWAVVGAEESTGVELSVIYQPIKNWQIQAAYTYDDARVTKASSIDPLQLHARNANAPRQQANFWSRYNIPFGALRGAGAGLGVIYVGDRNGNVTTDPTAQLAQPSYTRIDAALYYDWRRCTLALNVENLLDRRYIASAQPFAFSGVVPGDPRKITASVRFGF